MQARMGAAASVVALGALMWIGRVSGAAADAYHLTFDDEFNSVKLSAPAGGVNTGSTGAGLWETWYRSYPSRHLSGGNVEEDVDPSFTGVPNVGAPLGIDPFSVSNGVLTITAEPSWSPYLDGRHFTSGMLSSFSSFSQKYGYFECRAKLPEGPGLWPAFMMLPCAVDQWGNIAWKSEIDVFSGFGARTSNSEGGANQIYWAAKDSGVNQNFGGWSTVQGNIYNEYHVYGVDWQSDYITYYVDGVQVGRAATQADQKQPMFLVLSLALGGQGAWCGAVDPASGEFPAKMCIDYIRAYSSDPSIPAVDPQTGYVPSLRISGFTTQPATGSVNLSNDGGLDWSHWGGTFAKPSAAAWDHKANLISNVTQVGTIGVRAFSNQNNPMDWSSSCGPNPACADSTGQATGIYTSGVGNGFQFTVAAGNAPQMLKVYVGARDCQGKFCVYDSTGPLLFSDSSVNDLSGAGSNSFYSVVLPPRDGADSRFTVLWTVESGSGHVWLQGATLANQAGSPNNDQTPILK